MLAGPLVGEELGLKVPVMEILWLQFGHAIGVSLIRVPQISWERRLHETSQECKMPDGMSDLNRREQEKVQTCVRTETDMAKEVVLGRAEPIKAEREGGRINKFKLAWSDFGHCTDNGPARDRQRSVRCSQDCQTGARQVCETQFGSACHFVGSSRDEERR